MPSVTNISGYQFVTLAGLPRLRKRLLERCKAWGLRGTILLSTEGINVFVAGGRREIDELLTELRAITGPGKIHAQSQHERRAAVQSHAREDQKRDHRLRRAGHRTGEATGAETCAAGPQALAR